MKTNQCCALAYAGKAVRALSRGGSFLLLALATAAAPAGTMDLRANVSARFDPTTFAPLPLVFTPDGRVQNGQPGIYQIDVVFTAIKNASEKGWLGTDFDATVGGPGLALISGSYQPNNVTFDSNGSLPGGVVPLWIFNADVGLNTTDLTDIGGGVSAVFPPDDARNKLGTPDAPAVVGYPTLFGSFFVEWSGIGRSDVVLRDHGFGFSTLSGVPQASQRGSGASAGFGAVPEPTAVALLGVAFISGLGVIRRRS